MKVWCVWLGFLGALVFPMMAGATELVKPSQRIIAVGPGVTEMVYLLGAGKQLVGRDLLSHWPKQANALPSVGYHRSLSAEGLLSLQPDVVIGSDEMGPDSVLKQVQKAGVTVCILSSQSGQQALQYRLQKLGRLLGKAAQAQSLWRKVQARRQQLDGLTQQINKPLKVLFVLNHGGGMRVAGQHTIADDLIRMAGGVNVGADYVTSYRPLAKEVILSAQPDVILVSNDLLAQGIAPIFAAEPVLADTPAGKHRRVFGVDASLLIAGGSLRAVDAAQDLFARWYPQFAEGVNTGPMFADNGPWVQTSMAADHGKQGSFP